MIAFFDLDRTLLEINSGSLWVKAEFRAGYISRMQLARALFDLLRYHLGMANIETTLRRAIEFHAGVTAESLRATSSATSVVELPLPRPLTS